MLPSAARGTHSLGIDCFGGPHILNRSLGTTQMQRYGTALVAAIEDFQRERVGGEGMWKVPWREKVREGVASRGQARCSETAFQILQRNGEGMLRSTMRLDAWPTPRWRPIRAEAGVGDK